MPCTAEVRLAEVPAACDRIEGRVADLERIVGELRQRVAPVSRMGSDKLQGAIGKEGGSSVPLVHRLDVSAQNLSNLCDELNDITSRLEI